VRFGRSHLPLLKKGPILMRQVLLTLGSMGGTEVRNVFHSFWSAWFQNHAPSPLKW
jgi:hypothetical protein